MAEEITFPGSKGRGEPGSGAWEPSLNLAFITSKQKVLKECPLWRILSSETWKKKHIFLSLIAGSQTILWGPWSTDHNQDAVWCAEIALAPINRPGWNSNAAPQKLYDFESFLSALSASVFFFKK